MRLQDIIHETWDCVGSSLNALVEAVNAELSWASDVSGCNLKETLPISDVQSSATFATQQEGMPVSLEQSHSFSDSQTRKRTDDSPGNEESKRQRSDSYIIQTELSPRETSNEKRNSDNNSLDSAKVGDLHDTDKDDRQQVKEDDRQQVKEDDRKQVKVVLKGRTRHKAKELQNRLEKSVEVKPEVPKITSPTTKVVNLASKADETRLNSDKRLQSTVSSSLDILRKGLMKKPIASGTNQSIADDTEKRVIDSSGNSISSINTSFVRSSNPEIPIADAESLKSLDSSITRESTAIDRLSKIRPINHLKSLAIESVSLDKDRKLVLGGLQDSHLKSQSKTELMTENPKEAKTNSVLSETNISLIPTLKEVNPKTPVVPKTPVEIVSKIQNTILDALEEKPVKSIPSNLPRGKSCILDENGNLPEIQSDDSDEEQKLSPPKIANWAHTPHLRGALETQKLQDPDAIFGAIPPIHLDDVFKNIPTKKYRPRASSGVWSSLTPDEIATYKSRMGFKGQD